MTQRERVNHLEALANSLLKEWNAIGWKFEWNTRKRSFGLCSPRKKTIALSLYLLPTIDNASAEDTIRHELAHALDIMDRGASDHSWKWKAWAIKVGADPTRTKSHDNREAFEQLATQSKYTLTCPNGHTMPSHKRKKRGGSCGACGTERGMKGFQEEFRLVQTQNY